MPASTVTSFPSTASTRRIADMSIITPSVQAMSVNEWPDPATFTRRAPVTARMSSSSERGFSMRSGAHLCCRAQLDQVGTARLYRARTSARVRGRLGGRLHARRVGLPMRLGVDRRVAQVGLRVERRHTAGAGRGHGLAVYAVGEVARGEHAGELR